jgi:hypothetical protein
MADGELLANIRYFTTRRGFQRRPACARTRGPGDNSEARQTGRIEAGRYPSRTQAGSPCNDRICKAHATIIPRPPRREIDE